MVLQVNVTKTQTDKAILIHDKVDFKTKWGRRDEKVTPHTLGNMILNICVKHK